METVQVHPSDFIARRAIQDVLNRSHGGRIRQKVLDFWRRDFSGFIDHKKGGDVIFLVELDKDSIVGLSCAAILRNSRKCFNSVTVVTGHHTGNGIGTRLLRAKVHLLDVRYPEAFLVTYVSKTNEPSLKMCERAGLHVISEGKREREGKESTEFYVLSNRHLLQTGSG